MNQSLIRKFQRPLRATLWIVVVVSSIFLSKAISWKIVEKRMTHDVSAGSEEAGQMPVLVRRCDGSNSFTVGIFRDHHDSQCCRGDWDRPTDAESSLVTEITDADAAKANRDLNALVGGGNSDYFRVLGRGSDYVDVAITIPTTADFWRAGWYRIQNGKVHPQRICWYGPLWMHSLAPTFLFGTAILVLGYWFLERRILRKYGARVPQFPATNSPRRG